MDLTTKFGRQQAYAEGGPIADTAALIEDALTADDRERQEDALEVLIHVREFDVEHSDEFDKLLDELNDGLPDGVDTPLYKHFFAWRTEVLAAQLQRDQLVDLAIDVLSGAPVDHGQALAKILHGEAYEMARKE